MEQLINPLVHLNFLVVHEGCTAPSVLRICPDATVYSGAPGWLVVLGSEKKWKEGKEIVRERHVVKLEPL